MKTKAPYSDDGKRPVVSDEEVRVSQISARVSHEQHKRRSKLFGILDEFTDATDLSSQLISSTREDDGRE